MKPSTRAMIWYFSHSWRWFLPALVLSSVALAFFLRWMQGGEWGLETLVFVLRRSAMPVSVMRLRESLFPVANCVQIGVFSIACGFMFLVSGQNGHLPHNYLFTLPLSTRRFLTVSFGLPLFVVALLSSAGMALHFGLFGNTLVIQGRVEPLAFWDLPLLCLAAAAILQSLFHLSALKSELRVVPMSLTLVGMVLLCELCLLQLIGSRGHYSVVLAPVAIPLSAAFSHHALAVCRNGRQRDSIPALLEWLQMGTGRTRVFSSADAALYWLGWRRHGRVLSLSAALLCPAGALVALVAAILVMYCNPNLDLMAVARAAFGGEPASVPSGGTNNSAVLAALWALLVFGGAAFVSHIWMVTPSNEELLGSGSGYYLTLPVCGADLARARILAMAASTALVAAVGAGFFLLVVAISPGTVLSSRLVLVLSPFLIAFGLWLILWFGFPISVVFLALVLGSGLFQMFDRKLDLAYCLLGAAVVAALATTFFLAVGIVRRTTAGKDLVLFGAASLSSAGIAVLVLTQVPLPTAAPQLVVPACAMMALCIALPFAALPVVVHWVRHR